MKIYMYYFKHPDIPDSERMLYAVTDDKDIANEFESQRDMNKFIKLKKDISRDEYDTFIHHYSGKKLTRTKLETKDTLDSTRSTYIPIVCTWDEEKVIVVRSEDTYSELFNNKLFNPEVFDSKLQVMLYKLGFFTIYQWLYMNGSIDLPMDMSMYEGVLDDLQEDDRPCQSQIKLTVDQFSMFMYFYGETMR